MILDEPPATDANANSLGRATLDDFFRRAAMRRPGALALIDPPNRRTFIDGAPRYLTYAAADRIIAAIAGRLRRLGLAPDAIIGLQLANTVESVLVLLAVLRAGMIAAPLPLLWRRADLVAALGRVNARAIIAGGHVGGCDHCALAMQAAVEVFSIRHVCGFGTACDGVVSLSDLFAAERLDPLPPLERANPAAHLALITWQEGARGPLPVARSHAELIAGGAAVLLEGRIAQNATILATPTLSSFSGLALSVVPWLLSGGTLVLHQPFDPATFAAQCAEHGCDSVILPGPLAPQLRKAGLLTHAGLNTVLAAWRAPERLATSEPWRHPKAGLVDVQAFGEIGLIAARRAAQGEPAAIRIGPLTAPRHAAQGMLVGEIARTNAGTLALGGPMVPRHPFLPGEHASCWKADAAGLVDTGYPCRIDEDQIVVSGPPPGTVSVGGYRFVASELQELARQAAPEASIMALPEAFAGHRLTGVAADCAAVRETLAARGVNALVAGAFRERRKTKAA